MKKIVVLFSGTGTNLEYILKIAYRELEVVASITDIKDCKRGLEGFQKNFGG